MSTSFSDNSSSAGERPLSLKSEAGKMVAEWEMLNLSFVAIPKLKLIQSLVRLYLEAAHVAIVLVAFPLFQIMGMMLMNYKGEIKIQSAYGIAITMRTLFCYSMMLPMNDKLGIDLSRAVGTRNYGQARKLLAQGLFTNLLMIALVTTPMFLNSSWILQLVGVQSDLAGIVQSVLSLLLITCFLESLTGVLQTACFSQGIEDVFSLGTSIALILGSVVSYYLVVHQDFSINGWLIGKVVFDTTNSGITIWKLCTEANPETWGSVPFKDFRTGLTEFIYVSIQFSLSSYTEYLGYEIGSIFVYKCPDINQTAAYVNIATFFSLNYCVSDGAATVLRTRMNMLLSLKKTKTAKKLMIYYLLGFVFLWTLVSCGFYLSRSAVSSLVADSTVSLAEYFKEIIAVYSAFMTSDFLIFPLTMVMKSLGKVKLVIALNIVFILGLNFALNYWISMFLQKRVIYNFIVIESLCLILNIIYICYALSYEWSDIKTDGIEEEDLISLEPINHQEETEGQ